MSTLGVFILLGGTAFAATQLRKNSVRSKHIRNGQVKRPDLARNAVDSSKVRDGALLLRDFAPGQLPAGAQGPQGEQGLQGPQGPPVGVVTVQHEQRATDVADNSSGSVDVHCPDGQKALAGGFTGDAETPEATNTGSSRPIISTTSPGAPTDNGTFTGWRVTTLNPTGGVTTGIRPEVWVICAAAPSS
jgi:hypothetical protein